MQRGDRGRGRGRSTRREQHVQPISRIYQDDTISIRVTVDADDLEFLPSTKIDNTEKHSHEFTPSEHDLNVAKDLLEAINDGEIGKSRKYIEFRRVIDMYADARRRVGRDFGERNASNAFLKYYEMMSYYYPEFVRDRARDAPIVAFFNAELPGSSLVAVNHFMRTRCIRTPYSWYASSLVSADMVEGSFALDDVYGYMRMNRDRWLPSATNNGDMTSLANIMDIAGRIGPSSPVGGVDIYSHDAGIDVSGRESGVVRYDNQEAANARLHLGCALAGFLTMKVGAMFIAKQYTFYGALTRDLCVIYASMFASFYLCKALTSRASNSEIYLVGIGFRGLSAETRDILIERMRNWSDGPLLTRASVRTLPAMSDMGRFCRIVYGQQIAVLEEMLELWRKYTPEQIAAGTWGLKTHLIEMWFKKYPMCRIDESLRIPSK